MVLPLIAKAGMFLATKAPVTTALAAGVPIAGTIMGQEDRKRELVLQGEQGGFHKRNLTDKIFNALKLVDINEESLDEAKKAYLNEKLGPMAAKYGMTPDKNGSYFTDTDTLAGAQVKVDTAGERYEQKKAREPANEIRRDAFNDPAEVDRRARLDAATAEEKRRYEEQLKDRDKKYNAALVREAENRLEAAKIRAADRAENREMLAQQGIQASEDRRLTLQLEQMRDKRAFDERRNNAQMAMVAAVTASLGDLGDAFVSI